MLGQNGLGPVRVIGREPNAFASTFPSEIARCRLDDGRELSLLCKYGSPAEHDALGHRGGVGYEAAVYRDVLQFFSTHSPRFYGCYLDPETGAAWLAIEYVADAVRVADMTSPGRALRRAARWIGRFHADTETRLASVSMPVLRTYDGEYYRQWARRTERFASELQLGGSWLVALCERFVASVDALLASPPTVIHGEYGPKNILVRGGEICPVDWESTAIAAGEIDLVSLTQKWPRDVVQACDGEYRRARWPDGAPGGFELAREMARLYWDFRWLGDRPEWLGQGKLRARLQHLRATSERLALI